MGACSSKKAPDVPELASGGDKTCRSSAGDRTCRSAISASSGPSSLGDPLSPGFVQQISSIDHVGLIRNFYSVEKTALGVGSSSTVSRGRNRSTKEMFAIKTISKGKSKNISCIEEEIAIMRMLDHRNIVKLVDTFEDGRTVRLVMELCLGGELSDRLVEAKRFTECQAAGFMQQVFDAVAYLHTKNICHRDLKTANILFQNLEPIESSTLKLIDFGSACTFHKGQLMHTKAGSSYFVAPQVLFGKYDYKSDLWSCGIIMHILLCGYPPFYGENEDEVLAKVKKGSFSFNVKDWKNVSEEAQVLIRMLTKMNPHERCTAEEALQNLWIVNKPMKAETENLDSVNRLRRFQSGRKLQKASLHVIAEQLTESQIVGLGDIFMKLDTDGDGMLNAKELRRGLERVGLKKLPKDFQKLIEEVDADSADSGVVDYKQFVTTTLSKKQVLQETACWNAFSECGCDGDGNIAQEQLKKFLRCTSVKEAFGETVVVAALSEIGSGSAVDKYSFDEVMSLLRRPKEEPITLAGI